MQLKNILFSSLIFLTLFFAACASNIEGLYQDSSFNYNTIKENKIGVGGVISSTSYLTSGVQSAYGEALRNLLIKKYAGLNITPAGNIPQAIGPNSYQILLNNYQNYDVIKDEDLTKLNSRIHNTRYLVFARIVESTVEKNRSEEDDISNANNKIIKYEASRSVKVSMKVYDLTEKNMVWSATTTESATRTNNYNMAKLVNNKNDFKQNITGSVVETAETVILDKTHKYPAPPAETLLVSAALRSLVDQLPEFKE